MVFYNKQFCSGKIFFSLPTPQFNLIFFFLFGREDLMKILLACTFPGKWTLASVLTLCRCSQRAVWGVCAKWNCSRHLILSVIKLSVILLAYITKLSNIYASKLHICIKFYSYYYCRAITSETVALFTFLDVHTFLIEQQTQQFL